MTPTEDEGAETHEEIMRATYRALCHRGYAHLTMQDIADELGKSRTLLHYHFDTKEELMAAYLDRMIGWLRAQLDDSETTDPIDRLGEYLEFFVIAPANQHEHLGLAILEMRMQAIHNELFRKKLTEHYEANVETGATIIEDGIDEGRFRPDADPWLVAEAVYTAMVGARAYQLTLHAGPASARMARTVWSVLESQLLTEAGRDRLEAADYPQTDLPTIAATE